MKRVKEILAVSLIVFTNSKTFSQGAPVMDVNAEMQLAKINLNLGAQQKLQMEAVTKYVEQIQKAKQYIHVAKEGMKQAKQTADIMTAIMNENYTIDVFSDLNLNKNFKNVLEDVLCINFDDYTPNNSTLLKIHVKFMSGIGRCNNMNYYNNTYSGMQFKTKSNAYGYLKGFIGYKDYGKSLKRINNDMKEAKAYEDYSNNLNDRTKLEVGYKMLAVADEMIKSAEELQKILNVGKSQMDQVGIDKYTQKMEGSSNLLDKLGAMAGLGGLSGSGSSNGVNSVENLGTDFESTFSKNQKNNENSKGIDMSRAQRIELILKSHDYLQKGLEYKQRAIELIQECTNSSYAKAAMKRQKSEIDKAQLGYFLFNNQRL